MFSDGERDLSSLQVSIGTQTVRAAGGVHWATGGAGGWWGEAREESDSAVATQTLGTSSLCILQSSGKMPAPLQLIPHSSAATCISELLGRILSTRVHGLCVFIYLTYTH